MKVLTVSTPKPSRLTAALLSVMLIPAGAALAQDAQESPPSATTDTTTLDKVTVTGSRIKRAEVEGPAPVTVITADEIEKQGFSTVYEALNVLTQASGSVTNEAAQAMGSYFAPNANIINLRGLGPGRSLVLINGRRAAEYPLPYGGRSNFVNLAAIPASAVERIEVLSGGASAIYGSDAIAGVMNIITRKNFEGDEVILRGGTTTRGGGDSGDIQLIGGKSGDNWSLTYAFEYLNREAIYANQRDFMDSSLDNPDPALRLPFSGLYLYNYDAPGYVSSIAEHCDKFFGHFAVRTTGSGSRCGQYDPMTYTTIRGSDDNVSAYVSGDYDLANGAQLFADAMWWRSKATYAGGLQWWSPYNDDTGYDYYDVNRGALLDAYRVFQVEETGRGALSQHGTEESMSLTAGLRGTVMDNRFDYEVAFSHSKYEISEKFNRLIASKVSDYFLGPYLGTDPDYGYYPSYALNYDRFVTPMTPEQFAAISAVLNPRSQSKASQVQAFFSGDLFELPAGSLGFASVLEWGTQEYDVIADPRTLPTASPEEKAYNYSDTGGGGERDRYAIGVELSIPIFNSLKAQLAARYDKYDDITEVDDAVTWNGGLEWRPAESLLLRGSYATSFRAPDMHYVFADESGYYADIFDEYKCRDENDNNPQAAVCRDPQNLDYNYTVPGTRSGNSALEEETSKSWTAGFVWDIADGLSLQADYYNIKIENGVNDISRAYLLRKEADCRLGIDRNGNTVDPNSNICATAFALVQRNPTPTNPEGGDVSFVRTAPINTAVETTTGIDASVKYNFDTDRMGDFTFNFTWSHTLKYEFSQYVEDGVDYDRDNLQNFNMRSRSNLLVNWNRGDWTANVFGSRIGSLPNWAETGRISPYIIWNANVSKKITPNATIGIFVNNVFDKTHPRDDTFTTYPYFFYTFSPIGREVFAQFSYRFN